VDVSPGLHWIAEEMAQIEKEQFGMFVASVAWRLLSTNNEVSQALLESFVAVSIVVARRCGINIEHDDANLDEKSKSLAGMMPWS
jgi:Family of unknown function (DUF6086)